ncbi:uncharacterized protein [Euphorbia lathyris]|uniref:uncharacterized protein isoform X2 n=1 Tax=Euphorbia lathyris TaxID=212925 RepID=UPI003313167B
MNLTLTYSLHPYASSPPITIPFHRHNLRFLFSTSQVALEDGKRIARSQRLLRFPCSAIRAVDGGHPLPWDEKPYEITPTGDKAYLDEEDVVAFLDPPNDLIPLEPASYNPAAYLWKKIEDIPEDRRHRLLALLKPRLISRAWQIAGTRYEDPKLAKKCASNLLSGRDDETSIEFYNCRSSGGPWPIAWMKSFKKAIFRCNNGNTFGRLIGGSIVAQFSNTLSPLYFKVMQRREVMSTEQPCDLAYEMGDGHLTVDNYPQGFPTPGGSNEPTIGV